MRLTSIIVILLYLITARHISGQVDSTSFRIVPRYSFWSSEKKGEILLFVPARFSALQHSVSMKLSGSLIYEWSGIPGSNIARLTFTIDSSFITGILHAEINVAGSKTKYLCSSAIFFLRHKPNEVKTDRLTGGLIVNGLPFFPFGFYTYSPVYPTLPEEEVVKGFNLMSPYQRIVPETLSERKKYMDRCAQIGMKVNYNLVSVAGGGGVGGNNNGLSQEEKRLLLINEVKTFMDHPALLAWYIADEPDGHKTEPSVLEEIYRIVKETDPWHPVTMVFMTPFTKAKDYAGSMDIAMADPYPIPVYPVTMAGNATGILKKEFNGRMPVWIVPQAFGGGEHWLREPTIQEIRSMTWQAIIEGATGIQYFIRQGLNAFPKSTATWNECGRMAMEVHSITPWLLSDEETIQVKASSKDISVVSKMYRGQLLIMAVNKTNSTVPVQFSLARSYTGRARVLFENRSVTVNSGFLNDYIQPYGSQTYKIDLNPPVETVIPWNNNMIADPGFEDLSSPGIPSACYARPGSDRGATYFTDPRVKFEGNYSLRLITPQENSGATLRFFPVKVEAGKSYMVSVWAKADAEQRFIQGIRDKESQPQYVEVVVGDFHKARFVPGNEWKQYVTFVSVPRDTLPEIKTNVFLRMPGRGVAWFDMLQMIEDPVWKR